MIEKWDSHRDGPLTAQAMRKKLEREGYHVSRYVYSPGTYFPDHTHSVDKKDAVLSGRLRITMGAKEVILDAGDCIVVPRGVVHSAEVVGSEPVISLDATKG
jgi:quercetin dioxygenase-like cupin family protein